MSRRKLTKDEFIAKAKAVHGDKYNYNKVDYRSDKEKVIITCPIHGDFEITPHSHKNGHGCDKCAKLKQSKERRMTVEEFIARAKQKHGDRYDYSLVEINSNSGSKAEIKCKKCGAVFFQIINNHLRGHGCPECAKRQKSEAQRITKKDFVVKARQKHGDRYDYSLVEINGNNKTKVAIKCNACGATFFQKINNHLNGQGCPYCAKEAQRITKKDFVANAKEKHGDKYDYSLVEINGNNTAKVKIKCNKCGHVFEQRIGDHLNGHGCPTCAGNKKMTNEEFIVKARKKHGHKYGYDKVNYKGNGKKVTITCPVHGDFPQIASSHLNGQGCPKCNQSHLEEQTRILLEQNNIKYEPQQKFPWLLSKKNCPMKLDFYLPEYNIAIECQGIQHYLTEGNGYFSTEDVMGTQQRDTLKYNLCKEHGIPIYYIKYSDNVEESIDMLISKFKHGSK